MSLVLLETSLIKRPFFSKLVEICKIKGLIENCRLIIIDFANSWKFSKFPTSLIGYVSIGVEKYPLTVHLVVEPLSFIDAAFQEEEGPLTVSLAVEEVTLVLAVEGQILESFYSGGAKTLVVFSHLFYCWEVRFFLYLKGSLLLKRRDLF